MHLRLWSSQRVLARYFRKGGVIRTVWRFHPEQGVTDGLIMWMDHWWWVNSLERRKNWEVAWWPSRLVSPSLSSVPLPSPPPSLHGKALSAVCCGDDEWSCLNQQLCSKLSIILAHQTRGVGGVWSGGIKMNCILEASWVLVLFSPELYRLWNISMISLYAVLSCYPGSLLLDEIKQMCTGGKLHLHAIVWDNVFFFFFKSTHKPECAQEVFGRKHSSHHHHWPPLANQVPVNQS